MKMVKLLRKMMKNNDVEVVIGRDWADIVLNNGVYMNVGFTNEQIVNDFIDLIKQYKIENDSGSDFSADGTYKIGKKTVLVYHGYPYTI